MEASPLNIKLLGQVGDGQTYELGTVTVPVTMAPTDRGRTMEVEIDTKEFKRRIEDLAAAIAAELTH